MLYIEIIYNMGTFPRAYINYFSGINKIMAESKDYDELLYYWHAWHEAVGPKVKNKYLRYVQLANRAAKLNGI